MECSFHSCFPRLVVKVVVVGSRTAADWLLAVVVVAVVVAVAVVVVVVAAVVVVGYLNQASFHFETPFLPNLWASQG